VQYRLTRYCEIYCSRLRTSIKETNFIITLSFSSSIISRSDRTFFPVDIVVKRDTVQIEILAGDRIFKATLTVCQGEKYDQPVKTASLISSLEDQKKCPTLSRQTGEMSRIYLVRLMINE